MYDLRLYGLATFALKRGGSIHPLTLPPELTNETGIMNPSIFVHNGRILINVRHVNYTLYHSEGKKFPHVWGPLQYIHPENDVTLRTHNVICELDHDMNIISHSRIKMNLDVTPMWSFIGLEDGRLFSWDNRLFLCGVRRDCYDDKGKGRMEMCEIEFIDGEWQEVSRNPIPAPGDNSTYCEKNWMPILDMPWHFLKWTNPTEIVKYDIENRTTTTVVLDESKRYNFYRDIRGGSQVVRINPQQRMAITHEVDLFRDTFGRKDGHYIHRAIIWDNDWNIVHHTRDFHFMGSQVDLTTGHEYNIEFVTGLAFLNGYALISYGFQDNGAFVLRVPEKVFYEFLTKG
jgi:predicted GH43/DUF377 family glycosyl hydrolase